MNDCYVEDIFVAFFQSTDSWKYLDEQNDYSAAYSFYNAIVDNRLLTRNQSRYVLKILKNNKTYIESGGININEVLENPVWKNQFREIDNSKKLSVTVDDNGKIYYEFKFPYSLKETFEKEVVLENKKSIHSFWDAENRVRKLPFYEYDIIKIIDFANRHKFEIDPIVFDLEDHIEEIWSQSEQIVPVCYLENNQVVLKNYSEDAIDYWNNHKRNNLEDDLLLAKHMGYPLASESASTDIEKICSSSFNSFWIKNLGQFFKLYKKIDTKICVIIGNNNIKEWTSNFISVADQENIPRSDIKVCFREKKEQNTGFNQWIKDNGVGGSVNDGKIFLFNNAPAKWLYKDLESFKIIVTNMIIPPISQNTKLLFESHPCVLYIGDIKPTKMREINFVNL